MKRLQEKTYRFLRWSERYTRTDMVYLVWGGTWLGFGQIITAILSFALTVALAHFLAKTEYGDYRYVLSVFAILSAFTLTGISTAVVQSVAHGYEGALRQGVHLIVRWSIPAVALSLVGAGYYAWRGNFFLASSLILVACIMPLIHTFGLYASYLNGKKDFKRLSFYNFIDNAVPIIAVLCSLIFTTNVLVLLAVYFTSSTLVGIAMYLRTLTHYKPASSEDPGLERYSKRLSLLNIISLVTQHVDKVIVYTTIGSIELAIYGFAIAFPDQIRALLKNLTTLMVPKLAEPSRKNTGIEVGRKILVLSFVLALVTILYIATAPFLFSIFFPQYPESVAYSRILALMILSSLVVIPTAYFTAYKRETELASATIGSSLVQLAILWPAAHFGGLVGVCLARVLSSFAMTAISYHLLH
ncbi:MAG: oligosaccharide flippase family protein, partial [Candidatus Pacebacteria bacterium]|nr:oligosaccharide flippase family protein [Candidatus Paceibacterota bacterium]